MCLYRHRLVYSTTFGLTHNMRIFHQQNTKSQILWTCSQIKFYRFIISYSFMCAIESPFWHFIVTSRPPTPLPPRQTVLNSDVPCLDWHPHIQAGASTPTHTRTRVQTTHYKWTLTKYNTDERFTYTDLKYYEEHLLQFIWTKFTSTPKRVIISSNVKQVP